MMEKHIKIGDHRFRMICDSFELENFILENYQRVSSEKDKEFNINMDIEIEGSYGGPFLNYDVTVEEKPDRIIYRRNDYAIKVDRTYKQANILVHDEFALKHALMNLYSAFIVHHGWGLLIHSSCVIEGEKAHLFSGCSGAGKSTAAKLSLPRKLLSDEASIVRVRENEVTVFNSPFRSELKVTGGKSAYPLASIELLHQAETNKRIPLKKTEALAQLMDKVFYWSYQPEETAKIINLLVLLMKQVPVSQLHFQKNNTFWELISNEAIHS